MDPKERERIESESPYTKENREPKAMVSLGGTAITEGGKLTKSNYLRFLGHNLDNYDDIQLTAEEAKTVHGHLAKLSTGSTAMVPLFCGGEVCPFKERCPLYKQGKAPVGRQCLIENQLLKDFTVKYFEEFDVDPDKWTEVAYVNELAEIDIYLLRLNMLLSLPKNAELITDNAVGVDKAGDIVLQKQLSPFMEQKEKLVNRKSKIIKLMVGDRQEKYKKEAALKMKLDKDPSNRMAEVKQQLENLQRTMHELEGTAEKKRKGALTPQDLIDAEEQDA